MTGTNDLIKFDPSIALGSMIHLGVLIVVIALMSWRLSKRLTRIEGKQDSLLKRLK